jgi:hypothetical protein
MKISFYTQLVAILLLAVSCASDTDEQPTINNSDYSLILTGVNNALTYTFSSANSREATSVPDDVKQLTVMILDEKENVVYQQRYYSYSNYYPEIDSLKEGQYEGDVATSPVADYYYYENQIPDSIFIPKLPDGTYTVVSATADFYSYYYGGDSSVNADGQANQEVRNDMIAKPMPAQGMPVMESYVSSEGPIFIGKQVVKISDATEIVTMKMTNISAKITVKLAGTMRKENMWLNVQFQTKNNQSYSFAKEVFFTPAYDYDYTVYTSLNYQEERNIYVLPKVLTSLNINFYDYYNGTSYNQEIALDPMVKLGVGDAISFTIDTEKLLKGSGSGVFDWNDIKWNDLGEINVP